MEREASPWATLATCYEELFPLRPARLEMALVLAPEGSRVLDAGCAMGSLVRALAARGRRVHGLDLEAAFLTVARLRAEAEGLEVDWHQSDLRGLASATEGVFRTIFCLGQTLPHLLEDAEWLDFFAQARERLEPDGTLVIQATHDGLAATGSRRELPLLKTEAITLERRRTMVSDRLARFETKLTLPGQAPVCSEVFHRRIHPDLASQWLRQCGLEPDAALADETGKPFEETSPGWILVAHRR